MHTENIFVFTLKTNTEKQHDLYQRVIKQNQYEKNALWIIMKDETATKRYGNSKVAVNSQLQEVTKMTPVTL